ncbi:hypothetical protein NIES25_37360 [Nostoc linckia NIES-25]|nr:hypothetical protein NIES25_37360 [Nostoc linckia NIES-25]
MYVKTLWNHEPFANKQEAESCIQVIHETYQAFNFKSNKGENTNTAVWVEILCNPEIVYSPSKPGQGSSNDQDLQIIVTKETTAQRTIKPRTISNAVPKLIETFQKLLNSWYSLVGDIDEVTVNLDRNTLTVREGEKITPIIGKQKGFALIAAARRLQTLSIIYPFYNSKEWKNYIQETNGKLSVIGFQQDNYPRTKDFYIERYFLNSEGKEIKEINSKDETVKNSNSEDETVKDSIEQPKARILITGASGMGKTSYLKHLAMLCYRQEICQDYIPVYISLRRAAFLENQLPQDSSQKYIDIYMSILNNNWGVNLTHEQLINVLVNGKALVLIDGLDINHVNSFHHFNQIKELISMYPKNSFVISSKGLDFLTNSLCNEGLKIFELKNFDRKCAEEFIGKYLKKARDQDSSQEDINNILNRYSALDTLDTEHYNPLLLSCLCCYRTDESISEPEKNSKNSTELMQESIYKFVTDWDEVRSPDNSDPYFLLIPEQRIKLLGFLAIRFMQGVNNNGNQANISVNKDNVLDWIIEFINQVDIKKTLEERYLKLGINYSIESISFQKKIANYLLNSIELQDGLIVERYKGEGEILFLHGGIQKYLAAEYLSYLGLTELDKFLSFKGDWVEVVQQALRLMASQERFNKQHKN